MLGSWRLRSMRTSGAVRRGGACLSVALLVFSSWTTSAPAQSGPRVHRVGLSREEQRDFIDDLSNSREFGRSSSGRRTDPLPEEKLDAPTPEMKKIRPLIDEFSTEISLLNASLAGELRENRTVSSMLSDSYMITADVLDLAKRSKTVNDHTLLFDDLRNIDAKWGELSHRLKGLRGLSQKSEDHVANLDDIANDVRTALDIGQQVDYHALSMKTIGLATDLENLIDDIQYELHRSQEATHLTASTGQAHQQVLQLADLCDDHADLKTLASNYRRFQELWYPQAAKLQSQNRDGFARSLRRIAQSDGEITQLLLLQDRFDKTQIVYLTAALKKDITDFFYYATLDMCLKLPKANQVMSTASEFYGVCDNFIDTVENDANYDHIIEAFRYIEQADRSFEDVFGSIGDNDAASALQGITQTLNALRTALQVNHDEFNRQAASSLAAKIANLTDSIDRTTRQWLAHDRQSFSQQCLDDAGALADSAAKLQQEIVNGGDLAHIRSHTEDAYQAWRRVYNYLIKCQTDERPALGRFASRLTPALVDLRTQVSQ